MGNGEKAKMNKMHRNDTSSIILPSRQTLPPLRPKTLQKPTAIQKKSVTLLQMGIAFMVCDTSVFSAINVIEVV